MLCIIVVATFESLGLSNREKNLEMRTVQNIVIPVSDKITIEVEQANEANMELQEKLKISTSIDFQKKILERENILLFGAVEQYLFEHQTYIKNYEAVTSNEEKTKFFLNLILKKTDESFEAEVAKDLFVFDV